MHHPSMGRMTWDIATLQYHCTTAGLAGQGRLGGQLRLHLRQYIVARADSDYAVVKIGRLEVRHRRSLWY